MSMLLSAKYQNHSLNRQQSIIFSINCNKMIFNQKIINKLVLNKCCLTFKINLSCLLFNFAEANGRKREEMYRLILGISFDTIQLVAFNFKA
jgi:hypothetical protein